MYNSAVDSAGSGYVLLAKSCEKGVENLYSLRGGMSSGQLTDFHFLKDSVTCGYAFNSRVNSDPDKCYLVNPTLNGSYVFNHLYFINSLAPEFSFKF
jgi:hypothetical protein